MPVKKRRGVAKTAVRAKRATKRPLATTTAKRETVQAIASDDDLGHNCGEKRTSLGTRCLFPLAVVATTRTACPTGPQARPDGMSARCRGPNRKHTRLAARRPTTDTMHTRWTHQVKRRRTRQPVDRHDKREQHASDGDGGRQRGETKTDKKATHNNNKRNEIFMS